MTIEHPSFGTLDDDRIIIFDTTLRDGEQSPGFSMNINEKIRMAEALAELGVDVMEAGFPDRLARRLRQREGDRRKPRPARRHPGDLRPGPLRPRRHPRAAEAVQAAKRKRIHSFYHTSALHMKYKLRMEPEEVLQRGHRQRDAGAQLHRRRRVVGRGRHPHRTRLPLPLRRGRDQGRRHHHQHPRHGRLRAARGHARASSP